LLKFILHNYYLILKNEGLEIVLY